MVNDLEYRIDKQSKKIDTYIITNWEFVTLNIGYVKGHIKPGEV